MDSSTLQPLLEWMTLHPTWSGVIVFLVALTESLAIVGLFMPGAVLLFGIGTLVAAGGMALSVALGWAVAGAIVGDGISFLLGFYYKDRLRQVWPFRRYPQLMARGESFLQKHGGKSVFLGRFVGPVRPIMPATAGMLGMSPWFFIAIDAASAIVWAPAYILPGVAFGASLGLASEVAARLAILVVIVVAVLWFIQWGVRRAFNYLQPRADQMLRRVLEWSRSHRYLGPMAASVIEPDHPELRGLAYLAAMLMLASASLFLLLKRIGDDALSYLNTAVFQFFQGLRTPFADHFMVGVSQFGNARVNSVVFVAVLGWLAWRRRWFAAAHWIGVVAFGAVVIWAMKAIVQIERPPIAYPLVDYAFPSGHVTMSIMLYGFLAVMIAREHSGAGRWLPYVAAGTWVGTTALSRLYLGAHWLTDVLGGITLGLAWIALLGIAYRRHRPPSISTAGLTVVTATAFMIAGGWQVAEHHANELKRYAPVVETHALDMTSWWTHAWSTLPVYRADLRGRRNQPLTVQYGGDLDALQSQLARHGWRPPAGVSFVSALYWFTTTATIDQLPVLPQVHDGRHEALVLVRDIDSPERRLILRLWQAHIDLRGAAEVKPLWVGNISFSERVHPLPLLSAAITGTDFDTPLTLFDRDLAALELAASTLSRSPRDLQTASIPPQWSGGVVLLRENALPATPR